MTQKPDIYGIIPARYESTRFPGKPLALICGKPMFQHVYSRAAACPDLKKVVLAVDDKRIEEAARNLNVPVMMTRKDHASGTDRVLEAAQKLAAPDEAVIINIQGDEPLLDPELLTDLAEPFQDKTVQVTTPAIEISQKAALNPNQVKLVRDAAGNALYFSRAPIPFCREASMSGTYPPESDLAESYLGHIGIYAFRMKTLTIFSKLPPGKLESREKLEQLRLLENGIPVHVVMTKKPSIGVDTPEDIRIVEQYLSEQTR